MRGLFERKCFGLKLYHRLLYTVVQINAMRADRNLKNYLCARVMSLPRDLFLESKALPGCFVPRQRFTRQRTHGGEGAGTEKMKKYPFRTCPNLNSRRKVGGASVSEKGRRDLGTILSEIQARLRPCPKKEIPLTIGHSHGGPSEYHSLPPLSP